MLDPDNPINASVAPRTLRFPDDRSMGTISIHEAGSGLKSDLPYPSHSPDEWGQHGWVHLANARGDVSVPRGAPLRLVVETDDRLPLERRLDLSPLASLPPDALRALDLSQDEFLRTRVTLPILERELTHIRHLTGLWWIELHPDIWTDALMAHISALSGLRRLDLILGHVSDDMLRYVEHLVELQSFSLEMNGDVTDAGLVHLAGLRAVRHLNLRGTAVAGPGLAHLVEMAGLRILDLGGTPLDDDGLALLPDLPRLVDLDIDTTVITESGLDQLARWPRLRRLCLMDSAISDAGAVHISKLPALRRLDLTRTRFSDEGLQGLLGLVHLEALVLQDTAVTGSGVSQLEALSTLRELSLAGTAITHPDLRALAGLRAPQPGPLRHGRWRRRPAAARLAEAPREA